MDESIENKKFKEERNRMIMLRAMRAALPHAPVYCDIGAINGVSGFWEKLHSEKLIKAIYVDPAFHGDPKKDLISKSYDWIIPHALSDRNGSIDFFITRANGCLSCLEPNMELISNYAISPLFAVQNKISIESMRFDECIKSMPADLSLPHFVKVDVQGFEYNVLCGFGDALDSVLAIEIETQFCEIYKNQKLFHEIHSFLKSKGFILRDMKTNGYYDYEIVEIDAFFSRDPRKLSSPTTNYLRFWDIANDIRVGSTLFFNESDQFMMGHYR